VCSLSVQAAAEPHAAHAKITWIAAALSGRQCRISFKKNAQRAFGCLARAPEEKIGSERLLAGAQLEMVGFRALDGRHGAAEFDASGFERGHKAVDVGRIEMDDRAAGPATRRISCPPASNR